MKPLHIILQNLSTCVNNCDGQIKRVYFLTEDDAFFNKYNFIWDKISADVKK